MDDLYRALESGDPELLRHLFRRDVFVLTPTADGVLTSVEPVVGDLTRWLDAIGARGAALRLRVDRSVVGGSPGGDAVWVFDQIAAEAVRDGSADCAVPIRVTALLALDGEWRIAAAYWSMSFPTQAEQDAVKAAGVLQPGKTLEDAAAPEARPMTVALKGALDQPHLLPGLYSTGDDHVTIGSVIDEVFHGRAGQEAWQEFVRFVSDFTLRGPISAALVAPDAGWLAANIDIGNPPTPYRFFYVWIRDGDGWKIVISHDSVSRDPLDTAG